jgi:hypothetical protein
LGSFSNEAITDENALDILISAKNLETEELQKAAFEKSILIFQAYKANRKKRSLWRKIYNMK